MNETQTSLRSQVAGFHGDPRRSETIPVAVYIAEAIFELERIFAKACHFVGHENDVKEPGDFVTREIGHDGEQLIHHF
ncbi:MAG: hypothetical protein GDA49_09260 [Rhodospirillales bacterium]|nr:hypothetical protein [Rhodospirillales bacterium]